MSGGNGNFDYAFVSTNVNATLTNRIFFNTSGGTLNVNGRVSDPPVGTALSRYGTTSGHDIAIVRARDVSFQGTAGLTRALASRRSQAGDSGGPYTQSSGLGVRFAGVHVGSRTNISLTGGLEPIVYFTPCVRFEHRFLART